jgi:hypothetical protein
MRRKSSWKHHRRNVSTHGALEIDHDHQGNGDNLKQDNCDNPCHHIFRFASVIHFYSLFSPSLGSARAFQAFRGWTWIWIRQSVAYRVGLWRLIRSPPGSTSGEKAKPKPFSSLPDHAAKFGQREPTVEPNDMFAGCAPSKIGLQRHVICRDLLRIW